MRWAGVAVAAFACILFFGNVAANPLKFPDDIPNPLGGGGGGEPSPSESPSPTPTSEPFTAPKPEIPSTGPVPAAPSPPRADSPPAEPPSDPSYPSPPDGEDDPLNDPQPPPQRHPLPGESPGGVPSVPDPGGASVPGLTPGVPRTRTCSSTDPSTPQAGQALVTLDLLPIDRDDLASGECATPVSGADPLTSEVATVARTLPSVPERGDLAMVTSALLGISCLGVSWLLFRQFLPGFVRTTPERALEHPHRVQILQLANADAGLELSEFARRVSIPRSSLRHHIRILSATGHLSVRRVEGRFHVFPAPLMTVQAMTQRVLSRRPAYQRLLHVLGEAAQSDQTTLASRTGLSQQRVSRLLANLVSARLVERIPGPRPAYYALTPRVAAAAPASAPPSVGPLRGRALRAFHRVGRPALSYSSGPNPVSA